MFESLKLSKSLRQGSFFAFLDCLHCANCTFALAFEFAFTNLQWPQKLKMSHGFIEVIEGLMYCKYCQKCIKGGASIG
jgi:hypothetical protein